MILARKRLFSKQDLVLQDDSYIRHYANLTISLSTVVLNSRDCHENLWLPNFLHFQKPPYNRL